MAKPRKKKYNPKKLDFWANHQLKEQVKNLATQNNTLLRRNEELVADKQHLLRQIDELHEQELKPIIIKHSHKRKK